MFSPILNASASVILIDSWPWPRSRSLSRLSKPLSRFSPPLSTVARNTSGLVTTKFEGAIASTNWRGLKNTFFADFSSRPPPVVHFVFHLRAGVRQDGFLNADHTVSLHGPRLL